MPRRNKVAKIAPGSNPSSYSRVIFPFFFSLSLFPLFLSLPGFIALYLRSSRNSSSRFVTDIEHASCILAFENPFNCASALSISIVRCSTGRASIHANSRYRYIDRYMGARDYRTLSPVRWIRSPWSLYPSLPPGPGPAPDPASRPIGVTRME